MVQYPNTILIMGANIPPTSTPRDHEECHKINDIMEYVFGDRYIFPVTPESIGTEPQPKCATSVCYNTPTSALIIGRMVRRLNAYTNPTPPQHP